MNWINAGVGSILGCAVFYVGYWYGFSLGSRLADLALTDKKVRLEELRLETLRALREIPPAPPPMRLFQPPPIDGEQAEDIRDDHQRHQLGMGLVNVERWEEIL